MTALPPKPATPLRVHHLGLDARDALLLESTLRMRAELLDFTFGPSVPGSPVNVLFINGDSGQAMTRWQTLRSQRPELRGVVIARVDPGLPDIPWLARPVSVRSCAAIIRILLAVQA